MTRDPIAETVSELGRRLPPPLRPLGLLREVRDGLNDTAEAYRRAGYSEAEAADRAVADFGPIDGVVAAAANSALARRCRLTAATLAVGYVITITGWLLLSVLDPISPTSTGPGPLMYWFGLLAVAAVASGVWLVLRVRSEARRQRPAATSVRILVGAALAASTLTLISSYLVSPWQLGRFPQTPWSWHDITEVGSGLIQVVILAATARCVLCLLAARHLGGAERLAGESIRT
jgi:hypothetical protein